MFTQIYGHAFDRVSERLSMTPTEVAELLDQDKYVLLGKEEGNSKVHKLFYSILDNGWFIVVQDEANEQVVTVLPLEYHNRLRASADALRRARTLVEEESRTALLDEGKATTLRFSVTFEGLKRSRRTVLLGSIPRTNNITAATALEYADIIDVVKERIKKKIVSNENVVEVFVRLGKKGARVSLDLRRLNW